MKRFLLASLGLIVVANFGCLPGDSGGTPGTGGTGQGTAGSGQGQAGNGVAGTTGQAGSSGPGTAGDSGTAGTTGNPGTAGDIGTAGTTGNPGTAGDSGTAGTTGNPGTAGNGTAGRGGVQGTAGRGGAAGTGTAGSMAGRGGTTGTAGRGGTTGTAGTGGSAAGTTGTGGTSDVAGALDGAMLLGPCLRDTQASVCATVSGTCPNTGIADIALRGVITTDKTITLGGTPGVTYSIQLHIQGEVEAKDYSGGTDQNASGSSPNLDGWRSGGTPGTGNNYNVYMIRVTNPGATTHTDYFLNSLVGPGVTNHTTYGINYTTPATGANALQAQGGASLRLVAADSNCSMIKNCGPTANDGSTCAAPIILQNLEATAMSKNPTFNFSTAYNGQWIVMTVKAVAQN